MPHFKTAFFFLGLLLSSCSYTVQLEKTTTPEVVEKTVALQKEFREILNNFPLKSTPLVDTTNFEKKQTGTKFNTAEIELLQLEKIYPNILKEEYETYPSYKLELSDDYYTLILTIYRGDHELDAILINYSKDEQLISHKVIAYDEIAEGWSQIQSRIEGHTITKLDVFYGEEKQVETTQFHINQLGEINPIKTIFSSDLRPEQAVELGRIYTDTIEFSSYNDDYDYFLLFGEKNGKVVSLIYNWEHYDSSSYHFNPGDFLKITWKMDSIYIAGEGETLDFSEKAISAVKIITEN
ncbi:MAG TPA: hypothetical protein EYG86_09380 [Crocinitomicaceae bacterium]|nr:hypothetical protein [Crocinitomicaceae bacterium]